MRSICFALSCLFLSYQCHAVQLRYPFSSNEFESVVDDQFLYLPKIKSTKITPYHVKGMETRIKKKIIDQDEAVNTAVDAIYRYCAGVNDPNTPIAIFLFVGPTGVGKTQLAKELHKELFTTNNTLIRLNMSEYSNSGSTMRLIGSPPGYVDSEKGGQLTNALLTSPNSIVLLDEMDKAHPEVQKMFLSIFDEGMITSSMGKVVNCKNAIFVMTSNYCSDLIIDLHALGYSRNEILYEIEPLLMKALSPELYNRLDPVLFYSLTHEGVEKITLNMLELLKERVRVNKLITLEFDQTIIDYLCENGYHQKLGARPLKRLIENELTTIIAKAILDGNVQQNHTMHVYYSDDQVVIQVN